MTFRVFLVEDNAFMREYICAELAELPGIEVVAIEETEEAAKEWLTAHPEGWDLAVLDLFLASGTGAGIVRYCRRQGLTKPIVVHSNHAAPGVANHLRALGADEVFNKHDGLGVLVAYCLKVKTEQLLESCRTTYGALRKDN